MASIQHLSFLETTPITYYLALIQLLMWVFIGYIIAPSTNKGGVAMYVFVHIYTLQVTNDDCTGQQLLLFLMWHCERCTSPTCTACLLAISQEHDDLHRQWTAAVLFFQASEKCCGRPALSFLSSFCSTPGECGPVCNTKIPGALTCRVNSPCVCTYYAAFHASHPDHVKPFGFQRLFVYT